MQSYDYEYLAAVKEKFGITDFWATYSWGFAPEVEEEDHAFLLNRLNNFKKLGIRLHAYIQGPNVVYSQFPNKEWYAEDNKGRPITYYRGRRVVCLNAPEFQDFIIDKVGSMLDKGFDGIYMDNIQMGQLAIPTFDQETPFVFAGCNCRLCQQKFLADTGEKIPVNFRVNKEVYKLYLGWRCDVVSEFLQKVADEVHKGSMEFGTNSFEPRFNTKYVFGTDLQRLAQIQDYLLFENHSLPSDNGQTHNSYIQKLIDDQNITKPVFVLSYRKGIGMEPAYSQTDFDNIYTEDLQYDFFSMLKGSEFLTNGEWHNLDISKYRKLAINPNLVTSNQAVFDDGFEKFAAKVPGAKRLISYLYNPMTTWALENRQGRAALRWLYAKALR